MTPATHRHTGSGALRCNVGAACAEVAVPLSGDGVKVGVPRRPGGCAVTDAVTVSLSPR